MNVHGRVVSRRASGRNREPEILRKRAVAARGWKQTGRAHARKILVTAGISQTVPAMPTDRGRIGNDGWIRNRVAGPQQPVGT